MKKRLFVLSICLFISWSFFGHGIGENFLYYSGLCVPKVTGKMFDAFMSFKYILNALIAFGAIFFSTHILRLDYLKEKDEVVDEENHISIRKACITAMWSLIFLSIILNFAGVYLALEKLTISI